jgi:hypothetical protein
MIILDYIFKIITSVVLLFAIAWLLTGCGTMLLFFPLVPLIVKYCIIVLNIIIFTIMIIT